MASQQREPPPSLFLGPPSRNSSRTSLPPVHLPNSSTNPASSRVPLLRNRSALNAPTSSNRPTTPTKTQQSHLLGGQVNNGDNDHQPLPIHRPSPTTQTSALWAELQSTLAEVELSATTAPTHLFGPAHYAALEDLRTAQIALAQAWARSEASEDVLAPTVGSTHSATGAAEGGSKNSVGESSAPDRQGTLGSEGPPVSRMETVQRERDDRPGDTSGMPSSHLRPGTTTMRERRGSKLEIETESDILLARRRREANDRYFSRVNGGILDVVAKLEAVAVAMGGVERESRELWGGSSDGGDLERGSVER